MISNNEFFEFCAEEYRREFLLTNPEGVFTPGFVKHLNELFKKADSHGLKYNRSNCPKSDTWFAHGGRCGWAHQCDQCLENHDKHN